MLEEQRALLAVSDLEHSYPHCWRCHHPVIFRATEQWFISLETPVKRADGSETTFRQLTIEEIDKVVWDPVLGQGAHHQHDRHAPRLVHQPPAHLGRAHRRVPVRELQHSRSSTPRSTAKSSISSSAKAPKPGTPRAIADLLPAGYEVRPLRRHMPSARRPTFSTSGSTPAQAGSPSASPIPICAPPIQAFQKAEEREAPECLYLEGGDQHRGWFHSSLLTSVALRGRAPYSHVATAGWTLDEQGRAMSKSLGNGVDPVDIAERMGGEIVRLWVASIDFREDMAASENLMQRCAEIYRKLRNTFRFLLGNLNGFDPDARPRPRVGTPAPRQLHAGPHPRPH